MIWNTKTLILEVTNRCNLKCRMCDIWKEQPKKDVTIDLVKSILQDPVSSRINCVSFTGGEPFLIDNFAHYLKETRKILKRAHINISSNGYDTESIISALAAGISGDTNTSLTLSYDGDSHDKTRGVEGAKRRVLQTALLTKQKLPKIKLALKFTATRWNYKEVKDAKIVSNKFDLPLFIRIVEYLPSYYSRLSKHKETRQSIPREALCELTSLRGVCANPKYLQSINKRLEGTAGCHVRHIPLFISLNGKAYLCRKKHSVGNLQQSNLSTIIASKSYKTCIAEMSECKDTGCFEYIAE